MRQQTWLYRESVKDSHVSVTLWAEGRIEFVCSCCGHRDPQIWPTRNSPAEQKHSQGQQSGQDEAVVLHLSEESCPWWPSSSTWKPLTCTYQSYGKISETLGILLVCQWQPGKSPSAAHPTFTMRLLQHNCPHHLNTSRQARWGPLMLLRGRGSDQSFLWLESCSTPLHPSISSSYIKLA